MPASAPSTSSRPAGSADRARASSQGRAEPASYRYGWPVKPFRAQHPVRGFFGDPRIGNHGRSRQFHFGVDISAPNGTAVYATLTGRIWIHPLHPTTVAVVGRDGVELSYWHVVPTVRTGQRAVAYRTVIGHIEAPYGHVHFSEARNGRYLNPLRPGALGPFEDDTRPWVRSVAEERSGGAVVAEVYDETPLAVPRPWHDLPVMPAFVRWQLRSATRPRPDRVADGRRLPRDHPSGIGVRRDVGRRDDPEPRARAGALPTRAGPRPRSRPVRRRDGRARREREPAERALRTTRGGPLSRR